MRNSPNNRLRRPRSGNRAGSEVQFPGKLHDMMTFVEQEGLESIISWVRNGRAVMVHNPEKLVELLPLFFGQTKYRSFERQMNMWHFERVLAGEHKGAFVHPYFIKGNKPLCAYMSRHGLKKIPSSHHLIPLDNVLSKSHNDEDAFNSKSNFSSPEAVLSSSEDAVEEAMALLTQVDADFCGSELKDGDLSIFEGRQFYFVDSMSSQDDIDGLCQTQLQTESDRTVSAYVSRDGECYNLQSVFQQLQQRKRSLLQQSMSMSIRSCKQLSLIDTEDPVCYDTRQLRQ